MWYKYLCIVLFLASCCRCAISVQCIHQCFLNRGVFRECSIEISGNESLSSDDAVRLKFTAQFGGNSSDSVISNHLSYILAVICHQQDISSPYTSAAAASLPLCYHVMNEPIVVDTDCPSSLCLHNTSCYSILIHVFDTSSKTDLSPLEIVSVLERDESLTALHLAGVPLIDISSDASEPSRSVFDSVPIASWVFVVLGLVISTLTISKPIWWNRCMNKILKRRKSNVNRNS